MTKSLHPGKAAADGVEAALLAGAGFTGPAQPIEGVRGLAALMSPRADLPEMLRDLGTTWQLEENAFKPYSCGIVSHPVIDAGIALRKRGVEPGNVQTVEVVAHPVVLEVMGVENPVTGLQSKFSVYHCFAVGLLDGVAGPEQYSDERATSHDVARIREAVRVRTESAMPRDACVCTVRLRDGSVLTHTVDHAVGSVDKPMTDAQLQAKFELVTRPILGHGWLPAWQAAMGLDELGSVQQLLRACAPG